MHLWRGSWSWVSDPWFQDSAIPVDDAQRRKKSSAPSTINKIDSIPEKTLLTFRTLYRTSNLIMLFPFRCPPPRRRGWKRTFLRHTFNPCPVVRVSETHVNKWMSEGNGNAHWAFKYAHWLHFWSYAQLSPTLSVIIGKETYLGYCGSAWRVSFRTLTSAQNIQSSPLKM